MPNLVQPIISGDADMVIGSRIKALRQPGSMTPQQVFGNWLAVFLIKFFFKHRFTDLGPFRAISWQALEKLKMEDKNYLNDLKEIKEMMSKSSQFISLSGLSGVLAGIYALIGAYFAYKAI